MSRISSQGSVIMIQSGPLTVGPVAIAATKAKPAVVTLAVAAVPPAVGDIVVPLATGWNSLDGRPFKVAAVAGEAVTLADSDTTREVAAFPGAGASLQGATFAELCRSTFTMNNPAGATIDVTTLCDDAHRIVSGLPAIGTWTANGFYDVNDAAMFLARDAYRDGNDVLFDIRLRDNSGWTFSGTVNTFDLSLGLNAAVGNNIGGNIDGLVSFYPPPAP